MTKACILFSLLFLFVFFPVYAQEMDGALTFDPPNPVPKSTVNISLSSYSFNTGIAFFTWQINGVTVLQGAGANVLTVKMGEVGTVSTVFVRAELADGSFITKSVTLSPSSVLLLYEAPKSYVPVLYEGRSLPSDGATVRVTAIPQMSDGGTMLNPSTLSYSWYIDGELLSNYSGYGKQAADIPLDYLRDSDDIKVVVYSPRGGTATKTINIRPHSVMPLLYTYDQLFGTNLNNLIGKRFEITRDFAVSLEPFYVSSKETREPVYTWFLNGLPSTPLGGRVLSLHPKENSYGSQTLTVKVEGPAKVIQTAETTTELIFDTRK